MVCGPGEGVVKWVLFYIISGKQIGTHFLEGNLAPYIKNFKNVPTILTQ